MIRLLIAVCGLILVAAGAAAIYRPAGLLVVGLYLLADAHDLLGRPGK